MVLKTSKIRYRLGMSLVDTMVAVTILLIAFIGTSSFRYCAALDGRKAKAQTAAARIVLMLCESWRGLNGDVTFDPTELCGSDFNIDTLEANLDKPFDFNLLGSYVVVLGSNINLKNNQTLLINGDVTLYVTDGIILGNSAEVQIDNDSSLILYLGGNFEGKNSSTFNNLTQDTKKLQIYCLDSCENMQFKNGSDFYGVIYAPNADVIMNNSANLYGSVVARSFEQMNSSTFNYDASLRDASVNNEAVRFAVTNWHEQ